MKKILLVLLIALPFFCFSQNAGFTLLKKINGVEIYYKVSKTKETDKKDTWLVEFEYFNNTGADLFYKTVKETQKSDLLSTILQEERKEQQVSNFAKVFIENIKALDFTSTSSSDVSGDKTRLQTDKEEGIYRIKKGKTYTLSMDFKGKKGIEPVISIQIVNSISFTDNINEFL